MHPEKEHKSQKNSLAGYSPSFKLGYLSLHKNKDGMAL